MRSARPRAMPRAHCRGYGVHPQPTQTQYTEIIVSLYGVKPCRMQKQGLLHGWMRWSQPRPIRMAHRRRNAGAQTPTTDTWMYKLTPKVSGGWTQQHPPPCVCCRPTITAGHPPCRGDPPPAGGGFAKPFAKPAGHVSTPSSRELPGVLLGHYYYYY